MSKSNATRHPAEAFAKRTLASHPKAREMAAQHRRDRVRMEAKHPGLWPEWCFLPMAGVRVIMDCEGADMRTLATDMAPLTAALAWIQSKGIYRYDSTLFELLAAQPMDGDIPAQALMHLPEYCVFIEAPIRVYGKAALGFWAWMENDLRGDAYGPELRLLYLFLDGTTFSLPVPLVGTISESMAALAVSATERSGGVDFTQAGPIMPVKDIPAAINLVLYLCSEQPDVSGRVPQQRPRRPAGAWAEPQTAAEWDVGIRIGSAIRRAEAAPQGEKETYAGGTHASPRPHVRRAHWHAFWTGPKAEEQADMRRLSVRWLPPIPVKMDWQTEGPAVVHPVK